MPAASHGCYPNLIIAGAPKCGTTSLFRYLADHPQVAAAKRKETRFLMDRDYPLYEPTCNVHDAGLQAYEKFFEPEQCALSKFILEATPDYLYQETPLRFLPLLPEQPKILFVFRDPSLRILSYYRYAVNNLAELPSSLSFSELVDDLLAGNVPEQFPIVARLLEHSRYADYLPRWYDEFGRENIVAILFESLVRDPAGALSQLCRAIGIDEDFYQAYQFTKSNETIAVRSQILHRIFRSTWSWRMPIAIRKAGGRAYRAINVGPATSSTNVHADDIRRLDVALADANQALQGLTGLDVSIWQKRGSSATTAA